jgi:hypothetical protein
MKTSVAREFEKPGHASGVFKILYVVNLTIIILALVTPIIEATTTTGEYNWQMKYYAVVVLLSITFCISFLGLNVYGFVRHGQYRIKYLWTTILISAWVLFGVYQLGYGYMHDISF